MPEVIYGTPEQVATMASTWTRAGAWYDAVSADPDADPPVLAVRATSPSLTEVNTWLSNITGQMNLALQNRNFIVPIDATASPNAFKSVTQQVVTLVADLCNFKNNSGRFYSDKVIERGLNAMSIILKDMDEWVAENERGLIADHVPQTQTPVVRNQFVFRTLGNFPSNRSRTRGN